MARPAQSLPAFLSAARAAGYDCERAKNTRTHESPPPDRSRRLPAPQSEPPHLK